MGFFDWLFGKKKDPYSGNVQKDYTSPRQRPQTAQTYPQQPHGYGSPVPPPTVQQQQSLGIRDRYLSWRRNRSRAHVPPVADQTLGGNEHLGHLGGTSRHPDRHQNAAALQAAGLPLLPHLDALAAMVGVELKTLVWLASKPVASDECESHYTIKAIDKPSGGKRLLMVPLPKLKAVQRALVEKLVNKLPVHEAAHGFRKGRDVLTGASVHVGKDVVICADIRDFFPSFTFRRVAGYFRSLGYGRGTAVALANLTTARINDALVRQGDTWTYAAEVYKVHLWGHPELPQGAPTSPGIANAICRRMDKRLTGLARKFGADYTRYADDLTFSGGDDLAFHASKFLGLVRQIVQTEGLTLNDKKTRIMRQGRQQRVTGVVVNDKTNVSRRDYDRLKAILHNCVKRGPHGENRDNHPDFRGWLQGKIAHISHIGPERGRKLMALFQQIRW
ncbi:MAG: RNA-directed DNA polymerase [Planctomycetes bacterium]|nr:RNA-directed DNA polymerase [Planctomycetota bacterium]